ncbi:MAG: 16S rRNA (cytosine(1402)-N(4))-methyltransferase RsmH [Candidatus Omnitrophica bacterium]|nr:16S rRNA (cytosine(1402)-N(4))-methyltransferase RsmH [Candidatus Omnitrophota bacterium]
MHVPVLADKVVELLDPHPGDCVLDCTVGSAGTASAISAKIGPSGCLICLDRDDEALERARKTLASSSSRKFFHKSNFADLDNVLESLGFSSVDKIFFDLGVSRDQLYSAERGFSFISNGPLDMRMDRASPLTAADLVNGLFPDKLEDILRRFGEEHEARRIVQKIVEARSKHPIQTTLELADIIKRAVHPRRVRQRLHPATKTFQALRIAVNAELENIEEALPKAVAKLKTGGRVAVISFHSLEDRIVKNFFRDEAKAGRLRVITKKVLRPSYIEVKSNPSSRSARLRAAEKVI